MLGRSLFFLLLLFSFPARANFDFNSNCIAAYNSILSLKLNEARSLIAIEKQRNPKNSITVLLENYLDYYELFTSESKADFDRLEGNKSVRLSRLDKEDKSSPYYLYSKAEINLQWALIRGNFQEYIAAGVELYKAYGMLNENSRKFHDFLPNQISLGMINAVLGSLPNGAKIGLGTFGVRGNTQAGIHILETLVNTLPNSPYAHFYTETVFCLSLIQVDIVKDSLAYSKVMKNTERIPDASLLKYSLRAYAGMRTAHNNEAISILTKRPAGSDYQAYPAMDYLLGIANMHRLDKSAAGFIGTYLGTYKGVNYIKDAYLNLAWLALLNGDLAGYKANIDLVKNKGYTYNEKDQQALKEAKDPAPDIDLLKARLLYDGGYYDKARDVLINKKTDSFKSQKDKLEYVYRSGRIYDALKNDELAIQFYQSAINMGRTERYYFAANAALSIGMIYERKKNYPKANEFYNTAINMKNHDYENSIENKAKEGLKRIGN